jgi:low affinity Fe/Cu permease
MHQKQVFSHFARMMSRLLGHPLAFGLAVFFIVVWLISGPLFHFSDSWQLVINTGTTIITFLMVFLIQNTQNRDSEAMQVKLDELIHAVKQADNRLLDTEELTEQDLQHLQEHYTQLAELARSRLPQRKEGEKASQNGKKRKV